MTLLFFLLNLSTSNVSIRIKVGLWCYKACSQFWCQGLSQCRGKSPCLLIYVHHAYLCEKSANTNSDPLFLSASTCSSVSTVWWGKFVAELRFVLLNLHICYHVWTVKHFCLQGKGRKPCRYSLLISSQQPHHTGWVNVHITFTQRTV